MLARTDTVTGRGTPAVDYLNEVGTFDGHTRGLSHGHGHETFVAGTTWVSVYRGNRYIGRFKKTEWNKLLSRKSATLISSDEERLDHYWCVAGEFYVTKEDLTPADVLVLVAAKAQRRTRAVERARVEATAAGRSRRQSIPPSVKTFVWQRDEGKCVDCGSDQLLEFDHIIPVTMGGSNTARNLQLLCESCNRSKGGHLA